MLLVVACTPTRASGPLESEDHVSFETLAIIDVERRPADAVVEGQLQVFGHAPLVLPDRPMTVALYSETPDDLAWPAKVYPADAAGTSRLRCPDKVKTYSDGSWLDGTAPDTWRALRFVGAPQDTCATGHDCIVECDAIKGRTCQRGCPAPPTIEPPMLPTKPNLGACPRTPESYAIDDDDNEITGCARVVPPLCGPAQKLQIEGICDRVGPLCGARWGAPPAGAAHVWWVAAAEVPPADGSPKHPFTLEQALAARTDQVLVLSNERHALPRGKITGVQMYGACPAQTILTGDVLELAGTSTLAGLSIEVTGNIVTEDHVSLYGVITRAPILALGYLRLVDDVVDQVDARGGLYILEAQIRRLLAAGPEVLGGRVVMYPGVPQDQASIVIDQQGVLGLGQSWFAGTSTGARLVLDHGSTARLQDVVLESGVEGIRAQGESAAVLRRVQVLGARLTGVRVIGPRTSVRASDALVSGGEAQIWAHRDDTMVGPEIRLERAALIDATFRRDDLMQLSSLRADRAVVNASDLWIARGETLFSATECETKIDRARLSRADLDAVAINTFDATGPSSFMGADLTISDVRRAGVYLKTAPAAQDVRPFVLDAHLERVAITHVLGSGVLLMDGQLTAAITDLVVQDAPGDVPERDETICFQGICDGTGIVLRSGFEGVMLHLDRFEIEGAVNAGIDALGLTAFDIMHGKISGGPTGMIYEIPNDWRDYALEVEIDAPTAVATRR